jgi:hypothetical protein
VSLDIATGKGVLIRNVQINGSGGSIPVPVAPTGLSASSVKATSFVLSWDATLNTSSWDVYVNGTLYTNVTTNSATIVARTARTAYSVYVIAKNLGGSSVASSAISVTTAEASISDLTFNELGTQSLASVVPFGGSCNIMNNQIGSIFDLRIYPEALSSDDLEYYYDDVMSNAGRIVLFS